MFFAFIVISFSLEAASSSGRDLGAEGLVSQAKAAAAAAAAAAEEHQIPLDHTDLERLKFLAPAAARQKKQQYESTDCHSRPLLGHGKSKALLAALPMCILLKLHSNTFLYDTPDERNT